MKTPKSTPSTVFIASFDVHFPLHDNSDVLGWETDRRLTRFPRSADAVSNTKVDAVHVYGGCFTDCCAGEQLWIIRLPRAVAQVLL